MKDVRALAALALTDVVLQGKAFNGELPDAKKEIALSPQDQAFYRQLCFGCLRNYPLLDGLLDTFLKKALPKKDTDIKCLLLLGIYQLTHLNTPNHAALSATVEAARKLKKKWACGFINGVLRNVLRQHNEQNLLSCEFLDTLPATARHNHPLWLLNAIQEDYPKDWQSIIDANNHPPAMFLRVNLQQQSRKDYQARLTEQDITNQASELCTTALLLDTACDVKQLPGFEEGHASVQDAGAQLAARLLDLHDGHHVLDACAAPGGKSGHILESATNLSLVALDNNSKRLQRVEENIERINASHSTTQLTHADAAETDSWWDGKNFDRILLDAPCSGSGVINHHPDIKLLRRQSDVHQFAKTQSELLAKLWPLLKPGGVLLYCTCSILSVENAKLIESFLQQHADARHLAIEANWGVPCTYGRQLLPNKDKNDGFFYAKLSKIEGV